jgi:hypothetical protein
MAYKMNGFGGFGNSPAKQKSDTTKTAKRKSHTKQPSNKELLKMMEDLKSPKKKKSPAKQEGPIDEKQTKLQPSENPDTYVYKPSKKMKDKKFIRGERIGGLEDRISFIDETANSEGRSINEQEKKDKAKLKQELAILRKSKH